MARIKKQSKILEAARQRLAGLKSITPQANLSSNLTEAIYTAKIDSVSARLDAYNQKLAELDHLHSELEQEEYELNDLNRRFLSACEACYGPDSSEYKMLGGTRKSERKKPTKKSGGSGTGSSTP